MPNRKLFSGGKVVLPERVVDADLLVENEKIAGLISGTLSETVTDCERVDVTGKVLLPGLIDTHVHMWDPSPLNYRGGLATRFAVRRFRRNYYHCGYAAKCAASYR